jgi:oligosaccharide 4-alpha-D-glucosyltransferase
MKLDFYSRYSTSLLLPGLLAALLLTSAGAQAQRAADGAPANDPFGKRNVAARAVPGGRYQSHSFDTLTNVLTIRATDGSIRQVQPWRTGGVLKVNYFAPGQTPKVDSSVSVVQPRGRWTPPNTGRHGPDFEAPPAVYKAWKRRFDSGDVRQTNSFLIWPIADIWKIDAQHQSYKDTQNQQQVIVDKSNLRISIVYGQDTVLSEASSSFRREAAASTPAINAEPGGTAVRFRLQPGEQLYGTGARALPVNRRGHRLKLYNEAHYAYQNGESTLNVTLPVVLSNKGYLLFFDHYTAGYLDLGATNKDVLEYGGEGLSSLSYFVVTGKDQGEILNRYTALTGRQPLPPRWALGLIQSRFGYRSQAETENVAARMRREGFPLDALVHDLYWFGGTTRQGDLEWDQPHFPDPAGMMKRLSAQGVKTILISEPYVMRTSRNDSLVRTQGLVGTDAAGKPYTVASFWAGPATILDMYKPSARAWLWSYYQKHHDLGAHGWWSDLGEPENHPEAMHHVLGPTRAVHNAFGMAWASIFAENYAKHYPNERLFNLARSGWAGMQRNSVFPWSGDIQRTWSGYQAQVPIMLGMGAAGVGYMHSDAGGFCVGPIDSELYTRWLQMASFCPIMRPHGEGVPPEPFYYPEPYKSAVRDAAHLRYQLLPYLYTLAWQNTTTGAPLARMMTFDKQLSVASYQLSGPSTKTDSRTLTVDNEQLTTHLDDQYLLGPSLLVAPVLQPGQRRRNVVLPAGSWIDFYSNQTYAGGRTVGVPAPLARTPLLVKAGSFLPMTAYRPSTSLYRPDTLLLRYYPDPRVSESEFTMYDDNGQSAQALARRQYETLTIRGFNGGSQADVLLSSNGEYAGQPTYRFLRLLVQRVAAPPTAIYLDGQLAPPEGWAYDAARHELEVHFFMNAGTAVSLRGLQLLTQPRGDQAPEALTLEVPGSRSFGANGSTTFHYTRHTTGAALPLLIRDARGTLVRTLTLPGDAGPHTLAWDGRDAQGRPLAPGVYAAEAAGQHQRLVVTQ